MRKLQEILIAFILFLLGMLLPISKEIKLLFFFLSYFLVGLEVLLKAIRNIGKRDFFDENFLMSLATIGAFLIGEYPEAIAVMLFYQVGEFLQDYAITNSKKSITSLMSLKPDYAILCREGKTIKVSPEEVLVGDIILVSPSEKVPLDGIVIEGESYLNTVNLTGESVPQKVGVHDTILSGVINMESVLKIQVTKKFQESTVHKILEFVEHTSDRKTKSEKFITRFSKIYTPIVVFCSLLLVFIPIFIFHQSSSVWIYRALSFLVVSCPCSLVISVPLSFFSGIGVASKFGILVKGTTYLEYLKDVTTVVCDKTGTLTEGVFEVQKVIPNHFTKEELVEYAALAESFSHHPIAASLKKYYGKEINQKRVSMVEEFAGKGIKAVIDEKEVLIGNELLMEEFDIPYQREDEIGTILYLAMDHAFKGTIVISDRIKKDAKEMLTALSRQKIKTVMLTGDKEEISKKVASQLGMKEYYAELLPHEKVKKVEELKQKQTNPEKLLFMGDGMNDAPVMALADIGVAMGAMGSDAAIETADIVVMTDEPSLLLKLMTIGKKTMKIVHENIFLAIVIKILILLLSAFGITSMWFAVVGDVGVTLLAVINAQRILYLKEKKGKD